MSKNKEAWYVGGLCFECMGCGRCCAGPGEGYIWVTKKEVQFIAEFLGISTEDLEQRYTQRVGLRRTIIEDAISRDCIFLKNINGQRKCVIYSVRPNQCRTWPFWAANLTDSYAWNKAGLMCAGINSGKQYSIEEIEKNKKQKKWWDDE